VHGVIAVSAGGAWTFGWSMLTSAFPAAPAAQQQPEGGA
jgi:hypothetical protein